jgi:hypothetical protein
LNPVLETSGISYSQVNEKNQQILIYQPSQQAPLYDGGDTVEISETLMVEVNFQRFT